MPLLTDVPKAARQENDETLNQIKKLGEDRAAEASQVVFPDAAIAPAAGLLEVDVDLEIHDANDVLNQFGENTARRTQVNITGGTAAGPTVDGLNPDANVTFLDGKGSVKVAATGTGTVVLGLTDVDTHGLVVTDTVTVTFS